MPSTKHRWQPGQVIERREVPGFQPAGVPEPDPLPHWWGKPWSLYAMHVIEDAGDDLVTFFAPGNEMRAIQGTWPTPTGEHPWAGHDITHWTGHGCLMIHPRGADHAIWHFWDGPDREFSHWYINLQTDYRREPNAMDTWDLELDILVYPNGEVEFKDLELMQPRVDEGRFSQPLVDKVIDDGHALSERLKAGERWWDTSWASWVPEPHLANGRLP